MRKIYVGIVLSLMCVIISLPAFGDNLRQGFWGIRWRSDISELKGFSKISKRGFVDYYRNPGKVYTLNDLRIPDVIYGFYEDRFFAVYINIESPDAFGRIRDYMISTYGTPKESLNLKNRLRVYSWNHQTVKIKLKVYEKVGNMKLAFYYLPLSQKVNISQQEVFVEKTPRFFPIERDKTPEYIPIFRF
jgi:hypothetical protein